jgi:hypothetical protein
LSTNHLVLNDSKKRATTWGTIRSLRMLVKALKGIRMSKMAWLEEDSFKIYIDEFMMTEHIMLTSHDDRKL